MWKLLSLLVLFFLSNEALSHEKTDKEGISFDIVRHKSSLEQFMTHGHKMKKAGFKYNLPGGKGKRDNDSIALTRFLDDEFYGQIIIGHPAQIFNVAFDVSWNLAWVMSAKCRSLTAIGCFFHNKYDHDKSSEYKPDGRPYFMNIGKSNLSGIYSYDNISIAHSNVTGQSFVEMIEVPKEFVLNKADGVLGLGLKVDDYVPFFYTLLNQGKIKNPIFSIFLNRDKQSNRGGNVMLGFIDKKKIHNTMINNKPVPEEITYLNVENYNYWQFPVDRIVVNNEKVPSAGTKKNNTILCAKGCKGIVDSSSTTIYGPRDEVFKIHDDIKAKELYLDRYLVDCDTVNKLPKIDFILAGKNFTLDGPAYIVKMSYYSVTVCVSAFIPMDDENRWALGGAFLAEFYSVYNVHEKTVGFVKAA